jgi:2-polyprenyl-3-methyl-5-hydroxy-6-metoxy-1,4-benzoquinol methylase
MGREICDNQVTDGEEYKRRLEQESLIWGLKAEALCKEGIPWEVDRQQATRILGSSSRLWLRSSDPVVHEAWRGEFLDAVVSKVHECGRKVLDLGCGPGWLSLELARNGMVVKGIDISERCIEIARKHLRENPLSPQMGRLEFEIADLNKVVLGEAEYDCIVSFSTFHHLINIERLIGECYKALRTGGRLIVFDHVQEGRRNYILEACMSALLWPLPACYSYRARAKDTLTLFLKGLVGSSLYEYIRRSYRQRRGAGERDLDSDSPFEGVTGYETVEHISGHFEVEEMSFRNSFRARRLLSDLELGDRSRRLLARLFRVLDKFFCHTALIPGMRVYIVGRKA